MLFQLSYTKISKTLVFPLFNSMTSDGSNHWDLLLAKNLKFFRDANLRPQLASWSLDHSKGSVWKRLSTYFLPIALEKHYFALDPKNSNFAPSYSSSNTISTISCLSLNRILQNCGNCALFLEHQYSSSSLSIALAAAYSLLYSEDALYSISKFNSRVGINTWGIFGNGGPSCVRVGRGSDNKG